MDETKEAHGWEGPHLAMATAYRRKSRRNDLLPPSRQPAANPTATAAINLFAADNSTYRAPASVISMYPIGRATTPPPPLPPPTVSPSRPPEVAPRRYPTWATGTTVRLPEWIGSPYTLFAFALAAKLSPRFKTVSSALVKSWAPAFASSVISMSSDELRVSGA